MPLSYFYESVHLPVVGAQIMCGYVGGWCQIPVHSYGSLVEDLWHHFLPCQGCTFIYLL